MTQSASTTRIDRAIELRERILTCAHARVADGGFANLTMQALADDVGIATGSLYRHFRSKGELAAEVFAAASQREVDALAAALRLSLIHIFRIGIGGFVDGIMRGPAALPDCLR